LTLLAAPSRAMNRFRFTGARPATALRAIDVDQPVTVDGRVVTFWEAVSDDGDEYANTADQPPK
jgi:hypothetical protein